MQEALSGVRVVRAYRQEAARARAVPRGQRGVPAPEPPAGDAAGVVLPQHVVLPRPRRAASLWIGSREVINGRITVGQFVAFNSYLTMLSWPVIAFGWVTNMLQRGMASWKRMLEVLETVPADTGRGNQRTSRGRRGRRAYRRTLMRPWRLVDPRRNRVPRSRLSLRRHARSSITSPRASRRGRPSRWSG